MKWLRYIIGVSLSLFLIASADGAKNWYDGKRRITNYSGGPVGTVNSLDARSGASIGLHDRAVVTSGTPEITGTTFYFYTSTLAGTTNIHAPPDIVVPSDLRLGGRGPATGNTVWILSGLGVSEFITSGPVDLSGSSASANTPTDPSHISTMAYTDAAAAAAAAAAGGGVSLWQQDTGTSIYKSDGNVFIGANPRSGVSLLEVAGGISAYTVQGVSAYFLTHLDNQTGVTIRTTSHGIGYGIETANNNWIIFADDNLGGDLYIYKNGVLALEINDNHLLGSGMITAYGNLSGDTIYSAATNGVGGYYLYTKDIAGKYTLLKVHGAQAADIEYTMPKKGPGGAQKALTSDNTGQWSWVDSGMTVTASWVIGQPDQYNSGATPNVRVIDFPEWTYPSGVTLVYLKVHVSSNDAWECDVEEWAASIDGRASFSAYLEENLNTGADGRITIGPGDWNDRIIAPNSRLVIDVPATDVGDVAFTLIYRKDGDLDGNP